MLDIHMLYCLKSEMACMLKGMIIKINCQLRYIRLYSFFAIASKKYPYELMYVFETWVKNKGFDEAN